MKRAPMVLMILFILGLQLAGPYRAYAADSIPNIDAVLVLDASNSMNTSDPGKLSIEAMKMFIDMLGVQGDKVGVVSYTDQIEREKAMTTLRNAGDKALLKDFISQLKRGAYTDITVGLDEALRLMDDARDPAHKPVIIMLTDGNIELDARKGKTLADADRDTDRIIADAQSKGYPIYTIGLNYDGNLNRPYIDNIASQTGALCFETKTADELPDILSAIFADQMEIKIVSAGTVQADGDFQSIDMDIPDTNIVEANVTFLSGKPVTVELYDPNGRQIQFDDTSAILTQSNAYSLLKIIAPKQGLWKLRVKGVSGDKIKINLLYHYSVDVRLDIDNLSPTAGDTVHAEITLLEGGQPTANAALYQNSVCTVSVKDLDNPQAPSATMVSAAYQNGLFTAALSFPAAHTYEITAKVEHPNFFRESGSITLTAASVPAATATSTPATATPMATTQPTTSPTAGTPPEDAAPEGFTWTNFLLWGGLAAVLIVGVLVLVLRQTRLSSRVFSGRLVIEVTDHYTHEKMAPQYRNLIEYGKRANLLTLLNGAVSPSLSAVTLMPSPTAPSHMPQLIVKCTDPHIKFKKDFMEQDASRGIPMNIKSEILILLEAENKQVKIRYTE